MSKEAVREVIILHEWPASNERGYGRFSVCSGEYALDYNDAPAAAASSRWGWAIGVTATCGAALTSPLAMCLASAFCVALVLGQRVVRRGSTGRHRARRGTRSFFLTSATSRA